MNSVIVFMRLLLSVVAVASPPGAIVLLGYLYERMRRHSIAVLGGAVFVPPAWFVDETRPTTGLRLGFLLGGFFGHLKTGLTASLSLAVLVLPMGALLTFAWYAGWNNSFNKGYEYAAVGPLTGLAGIGLGMLTLCYLPLAQARQALTGDWRALFDWRTNLLIFGAAGWRLPTLPLLFALVGIIVAGARGLTVFAPQVPVFAADITSDPQGFLSSWFFWWGFPVVLGLYLLKRVAARLYARALLSGLEKGRIGFGGLHAEEKRLLGACRPQLSEPLPDRLSGALGATLRVLAPSPLWFLPFAVLFVQQFLNYTGAWGWLNQPLVWIPLLGYSP